jgi:hypothetical protein
MSDDSGVNFGGGPAGKEFAPIPLSDIIVSQIGLTLYTEYTKAPLEIAMAFSGGQIGVQDLSGVGVYRPAGV